MMSTTETNNDTPPTPPPPPPTDLLHLTYEGNFILECTATIVGCHILQNEQNETKQNDPSKNEINVELWLDRTTMHPQGGGQPSDTGTITIPSHTPPLTIQIDRVTLDKSTGIVSHYGTLSPPPPPLPESSLPTLTKTTLLNLEVRVSVNPERRRTLAECHTAGHIVDAAMARCGYRFPPNKGYHYLDGPYVEYKGKVEQKERETFLMNLKVAFQDIVEENNQTQIRTLPKDEASDECNRLAQNFDFSNYDDPTIRVVTVAGCSGPCGGTHVKSTLDLKEKGWGVIGLRCKKNVVRVRYGRDKL